ncbi:MAG TPA: aminotransferase class III-fold pyridoxal phosphate-dependent enzyme [Rhodothermales bacterium]
MSMSHEDLVQQNKAYTLASWTAQEAWNPISMARAEGVYFWDGDGKRYIDWSSQLMNVNVGHAHPHVIAAIREHVGRVPYAYPGIATGPRAELGKLLAEITPGTLRKSFFTLGGADAIENAMKIARLYTGRQKVLSRYRSYHGGTFGAMTAGGDPRRLANEPGVPWIVHIHDPYAYRSPLYRGRTRDEGDQALVDQIIETIEFEGGENVAAILIEGYSGSSGIIQGGDVFWRGIAGIRERYGILIIVDEVMSGFGRTGKWFGISHYPWVKPDIMVMAKGLTSGYVPLGAAIVTEEIADHFADRTLWAGLTYSAHALGCAAGIANIEVYRNEGLIDRAAQMGTKLTAGLQRLSEKHPCVGDIRGTGLLQVLELVKNREGRTPMSPYNRPPTEPMRRVAASLRQNGVSTFVRWSWIFCAPPLVINDDELNEGLAAIDTALTIADEFVD